VWLNPVFSLASETLIQINKHLVAIDNYHLLPYTFADGGAAQGKKSEYNNN
jgi:hypothetical protein